VAGDEPPLRARLTHDEQLANARGPPAALAGQERGHDPALPPHRGVQVLNIRDSALDLHDHQRPIWRLPPNEVDGSSIAEVIEGVLHENLPTTAAHDRSDSIDERGMLPVEKPRKLTAAPERLDLHANLKDATDRTEARNRQALEVADLGKRDQLLADARPICHVLLAPTDSAPNGAQHETDPEIVHRPIVRPSAHPRLTGVLASLHESGAGRG